MSIEFRRLTEVSAADVIDLMNNPLVRRQMPLTRDNFGESDCAEFIQAKERLWRDYGYGPWAILIDGKFAGWGGLQPEGGDADLGIVLHPDYWGWGRAIYEKVIRFGFEEMHFESITVLFPPSRRRIRGILELGFVPDGRTEIAGEVFIRYRLSAPRQQESPT